MGGPEPIRRHRRIVFLQPDALRLPPLVHRNARLRPCAWLYAACHCSGYLYTWLDASLLFDIEHKKKIIHHNRKKNGEHRKYFLINIHDATICKYAGAQTAFFFMIIVHPYFIRRTT
jgi:hypothetical protein